MPLEAKTQAYHRHVQINSLYLFSSSKSHLGNVLVDMKLIDIKDTLPVGFIPIQETVDTRESLFILLIMRGSSFSRYISRWFLCCMFLGNMLGDFSVYLWVRPAALTCL